MNMHIGCECNVVIATCPQRYLESTFLCCDNVAFTTLPQPKHNVVTALPQRCHNVILFAGLLVDEFEGVPAHGFVAHNVMTALVLPLRLPLWSLLPGGQHGAVVCDGVIQA